MEKKLEIRVGDNIASGQYSNLCMITHSKGEFVADFISIMPGAPMANVVSRIVMNPANCKRLLNALSENIRKYEENHGVIDISDGNMVLDSQDSNIPTPQGEA